MHTLKNTLIVSFLCIGNALAQQAAIPLWQYSVKAPSNSSSNFGELVTYTGSIVGRSPFAADRGTTTIPVVLVPVKLVIAQSNGPGMVFDPTAVSCVDNRTPVDIAEKSPLFNEAHYYMNYTDVGYTQYVDAFQRANFWKDVKGAPYHLLFNLKTHAAITVNVPANEASAFLYTGGCFYNQSLSFGSMNQDWFDGVVRDKLLPQLEAEGIGAGALPIFYLDTIGLSLNSPQYADSVSFSYHGWKKTNSGTQFYSVVTFNANGTTPPSSGMPAPDQPLSDELISWVSNPFSTNQTPAWGWVGNALGCYDAYAPAWPLSQYSLRSLYLNGFTYTQTELAFFSWFFDQSPSSGPGGKYSDYGYLTKPASAQGCYIAN